MRREIRPWCFRAGDRVLLAFGGYVAEGTSRVGALSGAPAAPTSHCRTDNRQPAYRDQHQTGRLGNRG